ncbi:MAG: PDZ domain-containing protein [Acidimicrobiales bacterium]
MSRRARRTLWISIAAVAMLTSALIAAAVVEVPYWSFSPGAIRDTADVITVEGADVHPHDGTIAFTTVSIDGRLSVLGFALAFIDPDADVVAEEEVLIGSDRDENRQINLQLMDLSTQNASYVALQRLGYEVNTIGTGAMIMNVEEDMPAAEVLEVGDTIVAVDGEPVQQAEDLVDAISNEEPGTTVTLTVEELDSSDRQERTVTLTERDDDPSQAFLGVAPATRDLAFDFPVDVRFDTGGVGGPSAGLAYTLALLDLLTPGDLTGGVEVAATGTIDRDGNVGPIGGLEYKAVGARRDGFDVFLVPADTPPDELEAAHRRAGDAVELIEVSTLDEALEALVELGGDPLPED